MTFGEYVETLIKTGLFGKSKIKLGVALFNAAGSCREPSESAVKTWMKGHRNCDAERYFTDRSIKEDQFIKSLKKRTNNLSLWKNIQEEFQKLKQKNRRMMIFLLIRKRITAMYFIGVCRSNFKICSDFMNPVWKKMIQRCLQQ